jgi:protein-tyrosine phosphatase
MRRTSSMVTATSARLRFVTAPAARPWNTDGGMHEIPLGDVGDGTVTGRLWLCGKYVVGPDPEAVLAETGAHAIVCLTQRHEIVDRYPDYVSWLDEHLAEGRAIWFPVHDLHAPPLVAGRDLVDQLAARVRGGEGLVVHCAAGIGRAGTTAVAILLALGDDLEGALLHVRTHRPMAGPEAGPQLDFLVELAQQVAGDVEPQIGGESK